MWIVLLIPLASNNVLGNRTAILFPSLINFVVIVVIVGTLYPRNIISSRFRSLLEEFNSTATPAFDLDKAGKRRAFEHQFAAAATIVIVNGVECSHTPIVSKWFLTIS